MCTAALHDIDINADFCERSMGYIVLRSISRGSDQVVQFRQSDVMEPRICIKLYDWTLLPVWKKVLVLRMFCLGRTSAGNPGDLQGKPDNMKEVYLRPSRIRKENDNDQAFAFWYVDHVFFRNQVW